MSRVSARFVNRYLSVAALALFLACVFVLAGTRSAQAGGVVGTGTPASCDGNALNAAVAGGGTVTFNCGPAAHTILANTVVVDGSLTIDGKNRITLDGENFRQLFLVVSGGNLTVRNLTVTNARWPQGAGAYVEAGASATFENVTFRANTADTSGSGGAIYNLGEVTITNSLLAQNASEDRGGAIYSTGKLTISNTQVLSNTTGGEGGGLYASGGPVLIEGSVFHNNGAIDPSLGTEAAGGAIYLAAANATVRQSSISGNAAEERGGGLYIRGGLLKSVSLDRVAVIGNYANGPTNTVGGGIYARIVVLNVSRSTIAYNKADQAGGVQNDGSTVTFKSTIIGDNYAPGTVDPDSVLDCDGPSMSSNGFNIISDGSCLPGAGATDRFNTPPLLQPISLFGIQYIAAPKGSSPAVDSGSNDASCNAVDQIGRARIGVCDVGSVEFYANALLPLARRPLQ